MLSHESSSQEIKLIFHIYCKTIKGGLDSFRIESNSKGALSHGSSKTRERVDDGTLYAQVGCMEVWKYSLSGKKNILLSFPKHQKNHQHSMQYNILKRTVCNIKEDLFTKTFQNCVSHCHTLKAVHWLRNTVNYEQFCPSFIPLQCSMTCCLLGLKTTLKKVQWALFNSQVRHRRGNKPTVDTLLACKKNTITCRISYQFIFQLQFKRTFFKWGCFKSLLDRNTQKSQLQFYKYVIYVIVNMTWTLTCRAVFVVANPRCSGNI